MHCPICDREDETISFDKKTGKFTDCQVCQAVIDDCLEEFEEPDEQNHLS
jgi:hypothetical protein